MVFGDSDISYKGLLWIQKPHGNGQGNGTGPSLWAGISSPMYKILRQEGYGVKLHGAISNITMETTGFEFDNAELIQGTVKGETILTLLWKAQKMLKLWEELLRVTSGALDVKDKSDWTLIAFK